MEFSTFFFIFIVCSVAFCIWVDYLIKQKPQKNKSDPTEFLKFDNLITKINNEYPKFGNESKWKEAIQTEALKLVSKNLGDEDEIYIKLSALDIQNLEDIVEFKKLIEKARDKHLKNEIKKSVEENKDISEEAKYKNSKNDTNISERVRSSIWSEYQGDMNWYEAKAKAKELGMRLPTLAELETAYDAKVTKSWKIDGSYYWTSKEMPAPADRAYYFNIDNGNLDNNETYHDFKLYKHHVRCIRS